MIRHRHGLMILLKAAQPPPVPPRSSSRSASSTASWSERDRDSSGHPFQNPTAERSVTRAATRVEGRSCLRATSSSFVENPNGPRCALVVDTAIGPDDVQAVGPACVRAFDPVVDAVQKGRNLHGEPSDARGRDVDALFVRARRLEQHAMSNLPKSVLTGVDIGDAFARAITLNGVAEFTEGASS
jgi:hypothetical protein